MVTIFCINTNEKALDLYILNLALWWKRLEKPATLEIQFVIYNTIHTHHKDFWDALTADNKVHFNLYEHLFL